MTGPRATEQIAAAFDDPASEEGAPMSAEPGQIELDTYQLALLRHTVAYPSFDPDEKERIFREHLAYTLSLAASGQQLAAGPVRDSPEEDTDICGMGLFQLGSLNAVRELVTADPGVRQGLYLVDVMTWLTPSGRISFASPAPPGGGTRAS
jgi:hypothetical protein